MGMPVNLALRGRFANGEKADWAWAEIVEFLRSVDAVFSTYRPDSVISRLGRGELALADCPSEVHEVLELGEQARVESDGAFDVRRSTAGGGIQLDPSGVVKGWAIQRAASILDDLADTDSCLSGGGDMVCRVRTSSSPGWRVGIEDPHDPTRILAVLPVHDGAVATSGLAQRGAHITDPRTGDVPTTLASVTVLADDLTWADIDATAAFVMGADAAAWLEGRGRTGVIVPSTSEPVMFGYASRSE
ncbi:FAD:protein FMN transferase [Nocardioides marmorisolisilvae]|uniref:FAD:protein FMN transferase n=2 Tax=Nocardioides marmorisolisilvae TaxID=1542737 RepID=A0A3N0DY75_9ACTN|nr:FAD:protein FMN transferase [Nocardioides marmorisolisilvae]